MSVPPSDVTPRGDVNGNQFDIDGLRYTLDRPPTRHGRRNVLAVRLADHPDAVAHTDRCDLFAFGSRRRCAGRIADAFGRDLGTIMGHLAVILDAAERTADDDRPRHPERLTPERHDAAEELLRAPDLLDRAAEAMTALGYVGEEHAKRIAYLVATSRLLAKPLSAILMAPSGCGKSELLDVVAKLLPEEAVEFLSRLTPQALFYAGPDALKHKLVIIDEQAGATDADYSLRTLQSKGYLRLRVPGKGNTSEPFTVHGPISLVSGTTSSDLNPEKLSRCLELALDDSAEQTERIQQAQRRAWAGATATPVDLQPWQDAQRLLARPDVVIPFAERLSFPARTTADRRGNQKLLGLVAAHALLHQRQREQDRHGRLLADTDDYAAVYPLLQPVVAHQVEGLSPRASTLYRALADDPSPITRREAAARLGWSYMTASRACGELVAQELVRIVDSTEVPRRYALVDPQTPLGTTARLTDPADLT